MLCHLRHCSFQVISVGEQNKVFSIKSPDCALSVFNWKQLMKWMKLSAQHIPTSTHSRRRGKNSNTKRVITSKPNLRYRTGGSERIFLDVINRVKRTFNGFNETPSEGERDGTHEVEKWLDNAFSYSRHVSSTHQHVYYSQAPHLFILRSEYHSRPPEMFALRCDAMESFPSCSRCVSGVEIFRSPSSARC